MAFSPPAPGSIPLPNPKKRPSMSSTVSASAAKRRQLHPLRQTSFPAQLHSTMDSAATPSARSETGSMFSATSSRPPVRGRGRPKKDKPRPSQDPDGASQTGKSRTGKSTTAKSVVSARSGAAGGGDSEVDEDEEIDDEDDEADIDIPADEAQRERDAEKLRMDRERRLVGTFSGDVEHRYSVYHGFHFDKKTLRKIVNAVMSQSANDKVIASIGFTAKMFIGSIIEMARDVQKEAADAYDKTRKFEEQWNKDELARLQTKQEAGGLDEMQAVLVSRDIARLKGLIGSYIPNPHRGGLLPDHLREAQRRYKARGESYSAGEQGSAHALLGVPGSAAGRAALGAGGRRLFR